MDDTFDEDEVDGRWLRRERNRAAIVAALLELCDEGLLDASASLIAERAGVSARSLFRYFDDVDDLYRTACEEQFDRVSAIAQIHNFGKGSTEEKVVNLVDQRIRLHEASATIGRVARAHQHRVPAIAKMLARGRDANLDATARHLADELNRLDRRQRIAAMNAIDVFLSWEAFDRFSDAGLSPTTVRAMLVSTITDVVLGARLRHNTTSL